MEIFFGQKTTTERKQTGTGKMQTEFNTDIEPFKAALFNQWHTYHWLSGGIQRRLGIIIIFMIWF
jgi:hypothetical protein